jgi:diguanylate cyclase (GGDEF)-like protein
MGHGLKFPGRYQPPGEPPRIMRGSFSPSGAWVLALAALVALYAPLWVASTPAPYVGLLWVAAPFLAAAGWIRSGAGVYGRVRSAFWALGGAAAMAAVAQLYSAYQSSFFVELPVALGTSGETYALVAVALLVGLGAALTLAPARSRASGALLLADALLLLLIGAIVSMRWVMEPLLGSGAGRGELTSVSVQQAVMLVPLVVVAVVALRRGSALVPRAAVLLLLGTLLLAVWASGLHAAGGAGSPERAPLYLWVAGWLLVASSALDSRSLGSVAGGTVERRRTRDRLRRLLVPGTAFFLAGVILHMGLASRPHAATVTAIAVLAAVLGLRMAHAFRIAERDAEQRRQLAHTQALVAVTHSLAGTTDLGATLQVISEAARSVFVTKGAGIELISEDGRSLETRAAVGVAESMLGMRFPVEGSFTGWVVRHGEPRATLDPSRDPYIQPQSLEILGPWPVAAAPIRFRGETLGALFACIRVEPFEAEELSLLQSMAEQAAIAIQNARLFEQVTVLSVTDPLTGLPNRRQLERELARDFAAAARGRLLSVVIFDLDDFKAYNDAYGHLAGDEALQVFAGALRHETRAMNLVARYGGDEFVALLSESDPAGAAVFVERVRRRFAVDISALGRRELSISAGIAAYSPDFDTADELLRRADEELYRTKPRVRT